MRTLYLRHCALPHFPLTLHSTRRNATTYLRPVAEARYGEAVRALRRRAAVWDPEVREALVGSYMHFSSLRPAVEILAACLRSLCNARCTVSRFAPPPPPGALPIWQR